MILTAYPQQLCYCFHWAIVLSPYIGQSQCFSKTLYICSYQPSQQLIRDIMTPTYTVRLQ